jgi:hypothetical protein
MASDESGDAGMANDEVIPNVGIRVVGGRILRLGMTREEAQPLLARDADIQAEFKGTPPIVTFIQSPKHWGTLDGIELFESAADEVVALIAQRYGLDPSVYCSGRHTYYFPDLNMILWRSTVSEEDGEQGSIFDCVSLHTPGYYDARTLEFIREKSGLPPVT